MNLGQTIAGDLPMSLIPLLGPVGSPGSCLLLSHWLKQVTWPNSPSKAEKYIPSLVGETTKLCK